MNRVAKVPDKMTDGVCVQDSMNFFHNKRLFDDLSHVVPNFKYAQKKPAVGASKYYKEYPSLR